MFYSYAILSRITNGRELRFFRGFFWTFMAAILVLRCLIAASRTRAILDPSLDLKGLINNFHTGYFTSIALVELVSAFFLLKKFTSVRRSLRQVSLYSGISSHLTRSTELRVATLALIGGARAVTYYFQPSGQKASSVANQIDRFIYTLECMFPVMMFIDMLASKLANSNNKIRDQRLAPIHQTWSSRSDRDGLRWDGEPSSQTELGRGASRVSTVSNRNSLGHPRKAILAEEPEAYEFADVEEGRRTTYPK